MILSKKNIIFEKNVFQEGSWNWDRNRSPLTYSNWANGEPNNANGNQDCLKFDGLWYDESCLQTNRPICQKFEI